MFDIVLVYFLLASGIVANKYLLASVSPDLFVGIRMFTAGLLLLPWSIRCARTRLANVRADLPSLFFISLCTTLVPAVTKAFALKYMAASKTALLGSIDPFVTALYAYILWQERLSFKKILGMLIGLCGVVITILSTSAAEIQWGEFLHLSYPELAALGSVALSRYGWILVQLMLKKERYKPVEINSMTMLISGALALMIASLSGARFQIAPGCTGTFVIFFAYTVVIGNLCGYTLYSYCLKRHSATWMSFSGFLVPVFVFTISALLGREQLSYHFFIAGVLLFIGLSIFYYEDLRKKASLSLDSK